MSSATFCTSAPNSSCKTLTSMPVSSLKGLRFAAMAVVGEVFSETKLSVVPANCFHMPPPEEPEDADPPPQPAAPSSEAPARPAPVILRKPLREIRLRIKNPLFRHHPQLVHVRAYASNTSCVGGRVAVALAADLTRCLDPLKQFLATPSICSEDR